LIFYILSRKDLFTQFFLYSQYDNIVNDVIGTRQMILIGKCSTAENTSSSEIRDTDTAGEI
jgi:hypothetical protein